MKVVIFAGGVGTRLWPLSRKNTPKQFEKIVGDHSMIQIAVGKLMPDFKWEDIYISTSSQYEKFISEQLPKLSRENIIAEPATRDVGPAVGLVTAKFMKESPNEPFAILWGSDHLVKKEDVFRNALLSAEKIVNEDHDRIVFIGQKPRFASENLGYIGFGSKIKTVNGNDVYELTDFKYRPDLSLAQRYVADGKHSWNLGYFVTTPTFLWKSFENFAPELHKDLKKINEAVGSKDFEKVLHKIYPDIEKISFDNAVLERLDKKHGSVISVDIGWSDIGAWEALKEALSEGVDENVTKGKVLVEDSRDSLIFNYGQQLTVGIDLEEMLVINTEDVVLVCPKKSVPKIKKLVESLAGTEHEHLT
jgi:mannose-1-phosphate guanylyltransferase